MNFSDKINTVQNQCTDKAIITDSKGKAVGKIIVRYTDSHIGYNNETGILFDEFGLDFGTTQKGSTYDKKEVAKILLHAGLQPLTWGKEKITKRSASSLNNCTEVCFIKKGNRLFNILWV